MEVCFKHGKTEGSGERSNWHPGFDWLRVLFISLVLLLHMGMGKAASGNSPAATWADVMVYDLCGMAVPGFLLMSAYLCERGNPNTRARWRRLGQAVALYVFWVALWLLHTKARPAPGLVNLVVFLLKGGGWAFYFFAVLVVQRLVAIPVGAMGKNACLACGIVSVVTWEIVFWATGGRQWWVADDPYWWPWNFIAIPFLGRWLALAGDPPCRRIHLAWIIGLFVVFACLEWQRAPAETTTAARVFLPIYSRSSPVVGALALLLLAQPLTSAPPRVIGFLARNSLGVFALHCFVLRGVMQQVQCRLALADGVVTRLVTLVVVLAGGSIAAEIVRRLLRERLI